MPNFQILLAEDETAIREILVELLTDEGLSCDSAYDGQNASEKLLTKTYDLLISDFRMPRMDGAQLLKWSREHQLDLPVIFITANKELLPDEKEALNDSKATLLLKPLDFDQLVKLIEDVKAQKSPKPCPV